jgi:hypothetical protein
MAVDAEEMPVGFTLGTGSCTFLLEGFKLVL